MVSASSFYVPAAVKKNFNALVRHVKGVLSVLDECDPKNNVADQVNLLLCAKEMQSEQVAALLSVLLIDTWGYRLFSYNLRKVSVEGLGFAQETARWKGVDIVLGYHHPDLGFLAINPKNPSNASLVEGFRKNELLLVYVGKQDRGPLDERIADEVAKGLIALIENRKFVVPKEILSGVFAFVSTKKSEGSGKRVRSAKKSGVDAARASEGATCDRASSESVSPTARPPAQASAGPIRMSQLISVPVSNELFHNGNVEAWKRIIRSYNARYPSSEVIVFYDGERIVDINTLFKWGKVKHGSVIQFAVSGEEIKDLSKLSKYFKEGASSRFEVFLHGSPDTVLNLF